ncbi:MAG: PmoA family protein [Phycisphaerae bacterium]
MVWHAKGTGRPARNLVVVLASVLGAAIALCPTPLRAGEAPAKFRLRMVPGKHVALMGPEGVLWQFNFDKALHLPHFHPVATLDGRTLTWDSPPDHAWHHALWFAWKFVGGVNYWELDRETGRSPGVTAWHFPRVLPYADGSARIEMGLTYRPAGTEGDPVMTERRLLETSPPGADGVYHLDWTSTFTAGNRDVKLDRTPLAGEPGGKDWGGYAGLSVRLAKDLTDRAAVSSDGPVELEGDKYRGKHTAMGYAGILGGKPAGIAILDHPKNLNAPTPWYVIVGKPMSFFSPAVLCYKPHTLKAGESMTLRYRVLVHPGRWDAARLKKEYEAFRREETP